MFPCRFRNFFAALILLPLLFVCEISGIFAQQADSRSESQQKADAQSIAIGTQLVVDARAILEKADYPKYIGNQGILVAEGDSWFDYPFFNDVLSILQNRYQYRIEPAAHHGDTLDEMVYQPSKFARVASALKRLRDKGEHPRAILLSAGGNDLAGPEFVMLLNHERSGLPSVSEPMLTELIDVRLRAGYIGLLQAITKLSNTFFDASKPIVIHGYGYPVPDGRGYLGGGIFPGPWLQPSFNKKGYNALSDNTAQMKKILDRFNHMLESLPKIPEFSHVKYLNLTGLLSNDLNQSVYKKSWDNELHPSPTGFEDVAKQFHNSIKSFPL